MALVPTASYAYAALMLLGGVMGYVKGGSMPSLIAGSASALILAGLEKYGGGSVGSNLGQAGVSAGLFVMMMRRFAASGKVMPAGVVAAASWLCLGAYLARHFLAGASTAHTH